MARIRYLKPDFFTNDELGELSPLHRIFFAGLWCHADKSGRLKDRPKKLKAVILPFDLADPETILHDLHANGFITRYKIEKEKFIQINNFSKHQKVHHKEQDSLIPPPKKTTTYKVMHESSMIQVGSASPLLAPVLPPTSRSLMGNGELVIEKGIGMGNEKGTNNRLSPLALSWNQICLSLPKVIKTSKARERKETMRLKEHGIEKLKEAMQKIANSSFCNGERGWIATYDWFIASEENVLKVLEGKYDNRQTNIAFTKAKAAYNESKDRLDIALQILDAKEAKHGV